MEHIGIKIFAALSLPLFCVSNTILSLALGTVWSIIGLAALFLYIAENKLI